MEVLKNVLYINLDHRTDRLSHVKGELTKIGIQDPTRFPAVKMPAGNVGCTISHIRCLEIAKKNEWPAVFICEDDITFMNPELFLSKLDAFEKSAIEWDVIIVAGNTAPPFGPSTDCCIRTFNVQAATGYIVCRHYYDIMIANFREGVRQLMKDPNNKREYAVDMYWKRLQQQGRWYTIIPLSVYQYETYSDIENRNVDYKNLMLDLEKKELMRMQREYMEKQIKMNKMW